jgi:hypothetical protein
MLAKKNNGGNKTAFNALWLKSIPFEFLPPLVGFKPCRALNDRQTTKYRQVRHRRLIARRDIVLQPRRGFAMMESR